MQRFPLANHDCYSVGLRESNNSLTLSLTTRMFQGNLSPLEHCLQTTKAYAKDERPRDHLYADFIDEKIKFQKLLKWTSTLSTKLSITNPRTRVQIYMSVFIQKKECSLCPVKINHRPSNSCKIEDLLWDEHAFNKEELLFISLSYRKYLKEYL